MNGMNTETDWIKWLLYRTKWVKKRRDEWWSRIQQKKMCLKSYEIFNMDIEMLCVSEYMCERLEYEYNSYGIDTNGNRSWYVRNQLTKLIVIMTPRIQFFSLVRILRHPRDNDSQFCCAFFLFTSVNLSISMSVLILHFEWLSLFMTPSLRFDKSWIIHKMKNYYHVHFLI